METLLDHVKSRNGKLRRKTQHPSPKLEERSIKKSQKDSAIFDTPDTRESFVKWQLSNLVKVCAGCRNKLEKPLKSPKEVAIRQREVEEFFYKNV